MASSLGSLSHKAEADLASLPRSEEESKYQQKCQECLKVWRYHYGRSSEQILGEHVIIAKTFLRFRVHLTKDMTTAPVVLKYRHQGASSKVKAKDAKPMTVYELYEPPDEVPVKSEIWAPGEDVAPDLPLGLFVGYYLGPDAEKLAAKNTGGNQLTILKRLMTVRDGTSKVTPPDKKATVDELSGEENPVPPGK